MSIETTPQELAITMAGLQSSREAVMEHAHQAATNLGFADRDARFIAVIGMLFGAAQLYALSGGKPKYELFKVMALAMAQSEAGTVVTARYDLGPEFAAAMEPPPASRIIRP